MFTKEQGDLLVVAFFVGLAILVVAVAGFVWVLGWVSGAASAPRDPRGRRPRPRTSPGLRPPPR